MTVLTQGFEAVPPRAKSVETTCHGKLDRSQSARHMVAHIKS